MTKVSEQIIGAALKIHKTLGPGLLENVYRQCLAYELEKLNMKCREEVLLPVFYESLSFENGYKADIIVNDKIIIEIKSSDKSHPAHAAQTLTYLKLSKLPWHCLSILANPLWPQGLNALRRVLKEIACDYPTETGFSHMAQRSAKSAKKNKIYSNTFFGPFSLF